VRWNEIFSTIDAHVAGQPLRLITFGVPRIAAAPIRDQIAEFQEKYDHIRRWLLAEPRGYAGLTGAVLFPSLDRETDYGVVFMSAAGYKRISGHSLIALATILIDTGTVPVNGPDTRITFDTFSGPIQARASIDQGRVRGVRFRNVPSFRLHKDIEVIVQDRRVLVDIAYGGNWYAIARADDLDVSLDPASSKHLSELGIAISHEVGNRFDLIHPVDPALSGIFGTVFVGAPHSEDSNSRNVTVYLDGLIDRSPCATGMAATMASLAADGKLDVSQPFVAESIIDTYLTGRIVNNTTVGEYPGIIAEIAGRGQVTGTHTFYVDPTDALANGFVLF
jgi:proline racemase